MTDILTHRGPDDRGTYVDGPIGLGVRRLSIIDIEGGHQPIGNEDGRVHVVYNGEIYNHPTLKMDLEARGHRYGTQTDTETVIHQFEEDGPDCVHAFNGMFAFAIWDRRERRLVLARDRLGIKPLYYTVVDSTLLFASEIKSLLRHPYVEPTIDWRSATDYFTYQNVLGDKTFFEGIRNLLPGHYLVCDSEGPQVHQYWDLSFEEDPELGEDACVEQYLALLRDSVRLRLMSDVPVGSHLSGGIDSSAVVTEAAEAYEGRMLTFSAKFPEKEFDESEYSRIIAEKAGTEHIEREVDWGDVPAMLRDIIWALDEPRAGAGVIPQWLVAKMTGERVKVVLTGHGGDELFAGYPAYYIPYMNQCLPRELGGRGIRDVVRNLPSRLREEGLRRLLGLPAYSMIHQELRLYGHEHVFGEKELSQLMSPEVRREVEGYNPDGNYQDLLESANLTGEMNRLFYLDVKTYLPALLANEDRTSMAFSVEARVPLLDHRLAEFSASIPQCLKVHGLTLKNIPRKAMSGKLPKDVLEHRKMGFPVPLSRWFRTRLSEFLRETLLGKRALGRGYFDVDYVSRLIEEHIRGTADHSEKLWCLLNFELWCQLFIDRVDKVKNQSL